MNEVTLKIKIDCDADSLFWYTLDPKNTPKWINGIHEERTSEWPPKIGTVYENTWDHGETWSSLYVSNFVVPSTFTLTRQDGSYSVRYTFTALNDNETEFEYFEWTDGADLDSPFTIDYLEKLKEIAESELAGA